MSFFPSPFLVLVECFIQFILFIFLAYQLYLFQFFGGCSGICSVCFKLIQVHLLLTLCCFMCSTDASYQYLQFLSPTLMTQTSFISFIHMLCWPVLQTKSHPFNQLMIRKTKILSYFYLCIYLFLLCPSFPYVYLNLWPVSFSSSLRNL